MRRQLESNRLSIWLVYAAIAGISLCFMVIHAEDTGFWYDEFAQICFSGLNQTILDSLLITDPTPPLFNVLANIWYDLVPYGERWLLLLPQLGMACGVYVCALWGEMLGGKRAGIWTGMLVGFSQMVIEQCGFEFRGYGFYLMFSALALYLHGRLLAEGKQATPGLYAAFCAALTGLLYSHVFGALIFAGIGSIDVFLILRRKAPKKRLLPFVIAGLVYLPWVLYFLTSAGQLTAQAEVNWMSAPTLWDVVKLIAYLCGNHIVVCGLFAAGSLAVLLQVCRAFKNRRCPTELLQKMVPFVVSAFVILLAFLYGSLRAQYASLWVKRYFTGLFPCCAAVCALGTVQIGALIKRRFKKKAAERVGATLLALTIFPVFLIKTAVGDTPLEKYYHREVTQVLYEQPDIREEKVMILSTFDQYLEGWEEYYCQQKGAREGLGIRSVYDVAPEELRKMEVVYFEYNFWEERSRQCPIRRILEEEYIPTQCWDDIRLIRYEKTSGGEIKI